jgi:hypothetical protein
LKSIPAIIDREEDVNSYSYRGNLERHSAGAIRIHCIGARYGHGIMLPFWLNVTAAVVPPFPSKAWVPVSANGPAMAGGAVMYPVDVYAKVPCTVALVHPLSSALAVGDMARASAVNAAIVKVLAMLHFMIISFAFIN